MAATLGKVAKRAGVAIDTARKALRGDPSVRSYLMERVQQAAKDLDYHPNLLARALRGNLLNLVPISVLELNQMYYGGLASSLSHRLVGIGMEPALCFNPEHLMRMSQTLSTSASILATGFDEKTVRALAKRQKVVTVDSDLPAIADVGNVAIDFRTGYRGVVDALVKAGRTRIAFASAAVIVPVSTIASTTSFMRFAAKSGFFVGASRDGACTSPASIAACAGVSFSGWR